MNDLPKDKKIALVGLVVIIICAILFFKWACNKETKKTMDNGLELNDTSKISLNQFYNNQQDNDKSTVQQDTNQYLVNRNNVFTPNTSPKEQLKTFANAPKIAKLPNIKFSRPTKNLNKKQEKMVIQHPSSTIDVQEKQADNIDDSYEKRLRNAYQNSNNNMPTKHTSLPNQTMYAVVDVSKSVRQGETIRLRTTNECIVDGMNVPRNTFIYGIITGISNNRCTVSINRISFKGNVLNVNGTVIDATDGREGLSIYGKNVSQGVGKNIQNASTNIMRSTGSIGSISADALNSAVKTEDKVHLSENHAIIIKLY